MLVRHICLYSNTNNNGFEGRNQKRKIWQSIETRVQTYLTKTLF